MTEYDFMQDIFDYSTKRTLLCLISGRILPAHAQTECGGPAKDPGGTLPH